MTTSLRKSLFDRPAPKPPAKIARNQSRLVAERVDDTIFALHSFSWQGLDFTMYFEGSPVVFQSVVYGEKKKWSAASIDYLLSVWRFVSFARGEKALRKALRIPEDQDTLGYIRSMQREKLKSYRDRINAKKQASVDRIMALLPAIPKGFERYLIDDVFRDKRFLYYTSSRSKMVEGLCSHCRETALYERPRAHMPAICPHCGSRLICRPRGSLAMFYRFSEHVQLVQRRNGILFVRSFEVDFCIPYKEAPAKLQTWEVTREVFQGDRWEVYNFVHWPEESWKLHKVPKIETAAKIYPHTIKNALKGTLYQYSQLNLVAKTEKTNAARYLKTYSSVPGLEYLAKFGMTRLAAEVGAGLYPYTLLRKTEKAPHRFLCITKNNFGVFRALENPGVRELSILQKFEDLDVTLDEFKPLPRLSPYWCDSLITVRGLGSPIEKSLRYLLQNGHQPCTYRDYLTSASQIGWDLTQESIRFPRDLRRMHDEADAIRRAMEAQRRVEQNNMEYPQIAEAYETLRRRYAFEMEGILVRPPRDAGEIVLEGQKLHHCVSTYVARMALGQTLILVARESDDPENPYATLEVKDGKVVQCRGLQNKDLSKTLHTVIQEVNRRGYHHQHWAFPLSENMEAAAPHLG